MKSFLKWLFAIFFLFLLSYFFLYGKLIDWMGNTSGDVEYPVSAHAESLHPSLRIADLYSASLLWDRDLSAEHAAGQLDAPRMLAGNYTLQVFYAIASPATSDTAKRPIGRKIAMTNRWPVSAWWGPLDRVKAQSQELNDLANRSSGISFLLGQGDFKYFIKLRKSNSYISGALFALDAGTIYDEDINVVDQLKTAGVQLSTLVHGNNNLVCGSAYDAPMGLTDYGKRLIRKLEQEGIILDLANASDQSIHEALQAAKKPLVISHTGSRTIHPAPENLSDPLLIKVAKKGIIGIGLTSNHLGSERPEEFGKMARHLADLVGTKALAIGSYYDAGYPAGWSADSRIFLTEALIQEGFSDKEIKDIMGENLIAFLEKNLRN